jgi:hypothetical protein
MGMSEEDRKFELMKEGERRIREKEFQSFTFSDTQLDQVARRFELMSTHQLNETRRMLREMEASIVSDTNQKMISLNQKIKELSKSVSERLKSVEMTANKDSQRIAVVETSLSNAKWVLPLLTAASTAMITALVTWLAK